MKKLIKILNDKLFNRGICSDMIITESELAQLLSEPVPEK